MILELQSILLQSDGLELADTEPNFLQYMTAASVILMVGGLVLVIFWYSRYSGLNRKEKKIRDELRGALKSSPWSPIYVRKDENKSKKIEHIRSTIEDAYSDPDTIREAIRQSRAEIAKSKNTAPYELIRYGSISALYLIFGTVATGGLELFTGPPAPETDISSLLAELFNDIQFLLMSVPFAELSQGVIIIIGFKIWELLFNEYFVFGLLLFVLGLMLSIVRDRYVTKNVPKSETPNVIKSVFTILVSIFLILLISAVANIGLSYEVESETAEIISGVLLLLLSLILTYSILKRIIKILKTGYLSLIQIHKENNEDIGFKRNARISFLYWIGNLLAKFLSSFLIFTIPIFIGFMFVNGQAIKILTNIQSSTIGLVAVLIVTLLVFFVAGLLFKDSLKILIDSIKRALRVKSVRIKLYLSVTPFAITFATVTIAWSFGLPLVFGIVFGAFLALLTHLTIKLFYKIRYRLAPHMRTETVKPSQVLIETNRIDIPTMGEEVYIGRLDGGVTIMSETKAELIDKLAHMTNEFMKKGTIPITVNQKMYVDALRLGQIDYEESEKRLRNKINHRILNMLQKDKVVNEEKLIDNCSRIASREMIKEELSKLRINGYIDKTEGNYTLIREDL